MGKRKAAKKPNKKAKLQPLDKIFRCLFCQHAGVVHCKLDRQEMLSRIECSKCGQHFETKIDHLTEPIDVYSLWIDAAEAANDEPATAQQNDSREQSSTATPRPSSKHSSSARQQPQQQRSQNQQPEDRFDDGIDDPDGDLPDDLF